MSNFKEIKKRLGLSATMPYGTGQAEGGNFLTGGHLHSHGHTHGPGCGCSQSTDHHDDDDESEDE